MPCCSGGQITPNSRPRQTALIPVAIGTKRRPPKNARYSGSFTSLKRLYRAPATRPLMMPESTPMSMPGSITLSTEIITR